MPLNLPKPIKNNSTIGLLCPASGFDDYKPIELVIKYLKSNGFKVKTGKYLLSLKKDYKYLSGTDKQRLTDFMSLWTDKDIDAIFCLRGGYGCLRLLNQIDFAKVKKTKKILLGFSDITVLHMALFAKCNLVTFHGPLLGYKFIDKHLNPVNRETHNSMWKILRDENFDFKYSFKNSGTVIKPGKATGVLIGGNLTDICSMIGSRYLPSFKDTIFFLEDCYEEPYRIDRLLTQIVDAHLLDRVKGFLFTSFYKCKFKNNKQVINLIKDKVLQYNVPIIYNIPIGHDRKNFTVPIGKKVVLDADNLILKSY
ncbi:MAG: LD-carboxypeptidase [Candidatus Melainabacteria bacterium]|nr:LD-carboxypeptidase [Candidatus Melainabacteria bacterium]